MLPTKNASRVNKKNSLSHQHSPTTTRYHQQTETSKFDIRTLAWWENKTYPWPNKLHWDPWSIIPPLKPRTGKVWKGSGFGVQIMSERKIWRWKVLQPCDGHLLLCCTYRIQIVESCELAASQMIAAMDSWQFRETFDLEMWYWLFGQSMTNLKESNISPYAGIN